MICDNCSLNDGIHCKLLTDKAHWQAQMDGKCSWKKEMPATPKVKDIVIPDKFIRRLRENERAKDTDKRLHN